MNRPVLDSGVRIVCSTDSRVTIAGKEVDVKTFSLEPEGEAAIVGQLGVVFLRGSVELAIVAPHTN